ncbi:hypothetical protein J6590_023203 [Homalodisca vitripennis]|nr:hypothetical protein J6590_023203 [Homalodisca vitripennis]
MLLFVQTISCRNSATATLVESTSKPDSGWKVPANDAALCADYQLPLSVAVTRAVTARTLVESTSKPDSGWKVPANDAALCADYQLP